MSLYESFFVIQLPAFHKQPISLILIGNDFWATQNYIATQDIKPCDIKTHSFTLVDQLCMNLQTNSSQLFYKKFNFKFLLFLITNPFVFSSLFPKYLCSSNCVRKWPARVFFEECQSSLNFCFSSPVPAGKYLNLVFCLVDG